MRSLVRYAVLATLSLSGLVAGPAGAADKVLTIYTYESFTSEWGPGPKVKAAFEESCACTVNFVAVADGVALLSRLKLEGETTKADLVLGLDTSLVAEARDTGLFEPSGTDLSTLSIPGGYADDIFVPYDYGHFAVIYDSEKLATPPASLKELVDGDASQKIAIQDPRTSTPGLGLLLWVKAVYGDQAPDAWAKLKNRVLTVTPGWSESYGLFTKGEVPMVLSYVTSPAYHVVEEKTERYKAAAFSEGHYVQIEVAGLVKTAPEKDLARQFLAFMISPTFQGIIPTSNWMLPVAKPDTALPPAFDALVKPEKTLLIDAATVAANRKVWVDEWLAAMSR